MKRRDFIGTGAAGLAVSVAQSKGLKKQAEFDKSQNKKRPNFLIAMADDLGPAGVGYTGVHSELKTPYLDAMSKEAVRCDRFYSAHSVCTPTRVSCLTGRHPSRGEVFSYSQALNAKEVLFPKIMKAQGYRTGHFGKLHMPVQGHRRFSPIQAGYDHAFWTVSNEQHVDPFYITQTEKDFVPSSHYEDKQYKGEDSHILVEKTLEYVKECVEKGQNFYINLWFHTPHTPHGSTPEYLNMYANNDKVHKDFKVIFAELTAMDHAMGLLRKGLRDLGVADDTFLCFCSDNGGIKPTADGLKGGKGQNQEGSYRVPGIIEWPGMIKESFATSSPINTCDFVPSICDILGINLPMDPIDGVSILPALLEKKLERSKPMFFHHNKGKEKLSQDLSTWVNLSKDGQYRLLTDLKGNDILADLIEKPSGGGDVSADHPDLVKSMVEEVKNGNHPLNKV